MRKLTVKNFSVIKDAELKFGKITVLIGPQSSGKSLLCKLAYFCESEIINIAISSVTSQSSFSVFENAVEKEFLRWFPRGGWTMTPFTVSFTSQEYEVTVFSPSDLEPTTQVGVAFGGLFKEKYIERLAANASAKHHKAVSTSSNLLSSLAQLSFRWLAGRGLSDSSVYIPLERSYFLDIRKGYRVLGSEGDPISAAFAAIFANSLGQGLQRNRVVKFIEGDVDSDPGGWSFAFRDGRLLPLSDLSSGGKETLPILSILDLYENQIRKPGWDPEGTNATSAQTYQFDDFTIEEPEASVFPSTQFELVKEFAELANNSDFRPHFTITTHSPYILSSFNNLIEADQVAAARPELRNEVAKLIPENYWIESSDFKAYCIKDGVLESIMDTETGLISANYLDSVSETIGAEFDELLRLGYVRT
jgi:hypothetical protein